MEKRDFATNEKLCLPSREELELLAEVLRACSICSHHVVKPSWAFIPCKSFNKRSSSSVRLRRFIIMYWSLKRQIYDKQIPKKWTNNCLFNMNPAHLGVGYECLCSTWVRGYCGCSSGPYRCGGRFGSLGPHPKPPCYLLRDCCRQLPSHPCQQNPTDPLKPTVKEKTHKKN